MNIKRISLIVVCVWLLFLSNSCTSYNSYSYNESNGFELSFYKQEQGISIEPGYRFYVINKQLSVSILPHSIPFINIDPIDEMGNFRQVDFDQYGNLEVRIPDYDYSESAISFYPKEPLSASLRKVIRNNDIKAAFLSTNQLKDESLTHTTELMMAAFYGDKPRLKRALKSNHNINQTDDFGRTALVYAAMNGNEDVFRFLLRKGADYKLRDHQLLSPLDHAEQDGYDSLVQLILEKDRIDHKAEIRFYQAVIDGDLNEIHSGIKAGIEVNQPNIRGNYPVHGAAQHNRKQSLKLLIENSADINATNAGKRTSLMIAAENGFVDIVSWLLSQKADIFALDKQNHTALIKAALNGYLECMLLLLARQPDSQTQVFMIAAENNHLPIVEYMLSTGFDPNAKYTSGISADRKNLYDGESASGSGDRYHWNALMYAAARGHTEMIHLLIDHGADASQGSKDRTRPLLLAVRKNNIESVKLLIQYTNDIDSTNAGGYTPLGEALDIAEDTALATPTTQ